MSTHIEFRHLAIRIAGAVAVKAVAKLDDDKWSQRGTYGDDVYLTIVESGSNNTIDQNGRIARNVGFGYSGIKHHVIGGVAKVAAGSVHGGCTRFANSRDLLPESYIRHYRKVLDNAVDVESVIDFLPNIGFCDDRLAKTELAHHPLWKQLKEDGHAVPGQNFYGTTTTVLDLGQGPDRVLRLALCAIYAADEWSQFVASTGHFTSGGYSLQLMLDQHSYTHLKKAA